MARKILFGRSGVGKSWYMGWYVENAVPNFDFAIHYDKEGEETGLSSEGGLFTAFYIDRQIYEALDEETIAKIIKNNQYVRFEPEGLADEEVTELFAMLCYVAMDEHGEFGLEDKSFHISADEAHLYAPESGKLDDRVSRLATGGRKYKCEWVFATQRAAKIDKDVLSQTDYAGLFEVRDVDADKVANFAGIPEDELTTLGKRKLILKNLNTGVRKTINTNELDREHPHHASDDGLANEVMDKQLEDGDW